MRGGSPLQPRRPAIGGPSSSNNPWIATSEDATVDEVPFDSGRWSFDAERFGAAEHLDRPALRLENGHATVADVSFEDGVLEVDVALSSARAFTGCTWRRQGEDFEWFWVRPHQSGNPDATQYAPAFNGIAGWQLYHGERYAVPLSFPFGKWLTVRVVFEGRFAEVYVGEDERPALSVDLKHDPRPGAIGLSASMAPGWFSRFRFAATASRIPSRPEPEGPVNNAIRAWAVSDAFAEDELDVGTLARRPWTTLETEPSGLADLARVNGLERGNTVFARTTIQSAREQVERLDLGFSDRVTVFLNGRPLFSGSDAYRSRDYRFLGSIGWWDSVYLPLGEGANDFVIAITEEFGGWGVQGWLEDLDGCSVELPA